MNIIHNSNLWNWLESPHIVPRILVTLGKAVGFVLAFPAILFLIVFVLWFFLGCWVWLGGLLDFAGVSPVYVGFIGCGLPMIMCGLLIVAEEEGGPIAITLATVLAVIGNIAVVVCLYIGYEFSTARLKEKPMPSVPFENYKTITDDQGNSIYIEINKEEVEEIPVEKKIECKDEYCQFETLNIEYED